ncbi:MAG: isoleucine--tRNA ligase [Bacteroidota bacterium]
MEYKNTLNLPTTDFPMRANSAVREVEIQQQWHDQKVFENLLERRKDAKPFILHDGPPYLSSGNIHIGHALNKVLKDIVVKYKAMSGYRTPFVPGYDSHGLPIENAVLKKIPGGRRGLTPLQLREKCKEYALEAFRGQQEKFKRLGVFADWDHPYITLDPAYEADQILVFGEMAHRGYIYKGLKPVSWCPVCETALAEAEVEYEDHVSPSIYVRFPLVELPANETGEKLKPFLDKKLSIAVWTTTPWTLPANLAIALGPEIEYTLLETQDGTLVVAVPLLESFQADTQLEGKDLGIRFLGKDLEGAKYQHPFLDRVSPVILGEHVTTDTGTGAVHTAPGHGLEDYEVGMRYGLDVLAPLDNCGIFLEEGGFVQGMRYDKANPVIIERLLETGYLLGSKELSHAYPHCWRCHKPVIYRATEQWFCSVEGFREKAVEQIGKVKWLPAFGETRIQNMVEGRTDWCVSRQRTWGVPIPVFYCKDCNEVILNQESIRAVADRFRQEGSDAWWKYEPSELLPKGTKCKCGSTEFRAETDTMDVWFDSGTSWAGVLEARKELTFPADLYLEGSDQYRGWFQSSLLAAVATRDQAPYKMVMTHGFTLDGQGRKMSKSLGNSIEPAQVIKEYGADILRLWVASVDYFSDMRISDVILKQLAEVYRKIRNTARFLLSNLNDWDPKKTVPYEQLDELDRYALHRLQEIIGKLTEAYEGYEFFQFYQTIQNYCTVDLSSFYLDIRKDRLYTAAPDSLERRGTQTVLVAILEALTALIAPVMSHLAEDIHTYLPASMKADRETSVFFTPWPKVEEKVLDPALKEKWETVIALRNEINRALEEARKEKVIGASLAAEIWVTPKDEETASLLKSIDLESVTITSIAHVEPIGQTAEGEKVSVIVKPATGTKCERCWVFSPEVGTIEAHPTLCKRCADVLA